VGEGLTSRHPRAGVLEALCSRALAGLLALCIGLLPLMWAAPVQAQEGGGQSDGGATASPNGGPQRENLNLTNPLSVLQNAGEALPSGQANTGESDDGQQSDLTAPLSIMLLLTVLSIAPAILVMTTSFTRIIVVLALLRQAIGTQSLPPSQVITGLALFMTFLIMAPTFQKVNQQALIPLQNGAIGEFEAWQRAKQPMRDFMFDQIEYAGNWESVYMIMNYRGIDTSQPETLTRGDVDMLTLVPSFILSELKIAFLMGFRLYLPFLIIDMVVASVLISMGMMMLPPILISLPFKLLLFVMVDGWHLVVGNLMNSFAVPGVTT
jgi:flagellar biosynthetic protein FliP